MNKGQISNHDPLPNIDLEILRFIESSRVICHYAINEDLNNSLANGLPGIIAFLECLQVHLPSDETNSILEILHKRIIQKLDVSRGFSLYYGCTGVLTMLDALPIQNDYAEIFNSTDTALSIYLNGINEQVSLDIINGLSGLVFYACCRRHIPQNNELSKKIVDLIGKNILDSNRPELSDFGIAHGMPGIVTALSDHMIQFGDDDLKQTINSLIMQIRKSKIKGQISNYPYRSHTSSASRLGWCYGDLSVAIALHRAGIALSNEEMLGEAVELIDSACDRNNETAQVIDAGLCHGSLGLTHLLRRCTKISTSIKVPISSQYWLNYFVLQQSGQLNHSFRGVGFLEGISGGALAALSALINDDAHPWDCVLFGNVR